MALVEVELKQDRLIDLLQVMLAAGPLPVPTLAILGSTRLLTRMSWQALTLDPAAPPGGAPPAGTVAAGATLTVAHLSLDELAADAAAAGTATDLTAWLRLAVEATELVVTLTHLQRVEAMPSPPSAVAPAIEVGRQALPLEDLKDLHGAAILRDAGAGFVTLRFAVGADDDLTVPPANRLAAPEHDGQEWLIRVSGEVFADMVRDQLAAALDPPPSGVTSVPQPGALWLPALPSATGAATQGPWGVSASVELEKVDACADVDLTVEIRVGLSLDPVIGAASLDDSVLNLGLRIESDASDWDVARCWLGTGALAALLLGLTTSIVAGVGAAIQSLLLIAEFVRHEAGNAVASTAVSGFVQTSRDTTSATYARQVPLPVFPLASEAHAEVGPDGLVVLGRFALIVPPSHVVTFDPDGGALEGQWHGSYDCGDHRWEESYDVGSVVVRDRLEIAGAVIRRLGVTIFPTTTFLPATPGGGILPLQPTRWVYDAPAFADGAPAVTPRRTAPPPVGQHVLFFLHTSAGLRRYDIGPVPEQPEAPSAMELAVHDVQCRQLVKRWSRQEQIRWLVDPPPFDYGLPPLRQWMLVFRGPGAHGAIRVHDGARRPLAEGALQGESSGVLEVLTTADVELEVEHELEGAEVEARVLQRWLVPTELVRLPGPVERLAVLRAPVGRAGGVLALADGRAWAFVGGAWVPHAHGSRPTRSRGAPLLSVSLPGGQVAAVWNEHLVVGVPWGASIRARPQRLRAAALDVTLRDEVPMT